LIFHPGFEMGLAQANQGRAISTMGRFSVVWKLPKIFPGRSDAGEIRRLS
jgi:hypothetical protein